MSSSSGKTLADAFARDEPRVKRRKVRKGTQSCWECKRRKVRCIFASDSNTICENCERRGTSCISQELPDQPAPFVNSNPQVIEARLGRVEQLLDHLISHTVQSSTGALPDIRSIWAVPENRDESRANVVPPTINSTVRISQY